MIDRLDYLRTAQPGNVAQPHSTKIEQYLAKAWDKLAGDDGGMQGDKLLGRTEAMEWHPPILSFKIERPGGFVPGSSRAEIQFWNVDTANWTATLAKTSRRQVFTMDSRLNVKPIADEIRVAISEGRDDPRIKWLGANRVRILIGEVIPETNKQTTLA